MGRKGFNCGGGAREFDRWDAGTAECTMGKERAGEAAIPLGSPLSVLRKCMSTPPISIMN